MTLSVTVTGTGESATMSEMDEVMLEYMAYIVYSLRRPFCYKDFLRFEVDGNIYSMRHGTFRNKISKLLREHQAELCYYSNLAFYTLKEHRFGKPMTHDRMVVHSNPFLTFLENLPFDKQSIHDIRLKFRAPRIWKTFSVSPRFYRNKRSHDILIPAWRKDSAIIQVTIHRTDVVSVAVGCSLNPIPLNSKGLISFFTLLARIEERLGNISNSVSHVNIIESPTLIPDYRQWIVTMWHFGRDALIEYTGEKFSISVEDTEHIIRRVYAKDFESTSRIRAERQEYPKKTLVDVIDEIIQGP